MTNVQPERTDTFDIEPTEKEQESNQEEKNFEIVDKTVQVKDCDKCNIDYVVQLDKKIDSLSYEDIYKFLCTISASCSNNVEFTEYSNKTLFKLLQQYPKDFAGILSSYPELRNEYLFVQLSSPLLDYDIRGIIQQVETSQADSIVKKRIINSLEKIR